METKSHSWKPIVYIAATLGGVAAVLGTLFLLVRLAHPELLRPGHARMTGVIAGFIAFGTVVAVTRLLKRFFGREFGTYLDDADGPAEGQRPALEKVCTRCGAVFGAFRNDFHDAGFCSRACRAAFARRRAP